MITPVKHYFYKIINFFFILRLQDLKINEIINQSNKEKLKIKHTYEMQIKEIKRKQWVTFFLNLFINRLH